MPGHSKKILVLGSGAVAPPCVDYLTRNPNNLVTVACRTLATAQKLSSGFPRVIKSAIKSKTQVVTTSYVSEGIRALDGAAKEAGITVLNEVGVDPGVDHLYAIKKIGEVHAKGGKVREFYSYCGGLPAPDCADNPLGFKFSWSPRGALLSQRNSARFLKNGEVVEIPSTELMATAKPYYVMDGYDFVAYSNRDSVPFREFYGIPEAQTVIRGSLRYAGNPAFVQALADLGWLEQDKKEWLIDGMTWADIQQRALGTSAKDEKYATSLRTHPGHFWMPTCTVGRRLTGTIENGTQNPHIAHRGFGQVSEQGRKRADHFRHEMDGLLSSEKATIAGGNLLDTLCAQLEKLMSFKPGERDLVMLQHKFVVEWANGRVETLTSTLELLGDPQRYSGMSNSVGTTCGIATQLMMDGHPALSKPGVLAPYSVEMCDPIRALLEKEGIKMVDATVKG
ncbi:MAG: hypothetical protein M1812_004492 [Candelaria pacifica]|nr:MAG: hypothetical protein M1812_004492 [Candelaria pacifica]